MKCLFVAALAALLVCGSATAQAADKPDEQPKPTYRRKLPRLADRKQRKATEPTTPSQGRWYAGVTGGNSTFGSWSTAETVDDGSFTSPGGDDAGSNLQLFLGFEFNPRHSLELTYAELGSATYRAQADGSGVRWAAGPIREKADFSGITLSYQGGLPITARSQAFVKLGVNGWQVHSTYTGTTNAGGPIRRSDSSSSWDLLYGAGVSFDPSPAWRLRAAYVMYHFTDLGRAERSADAKALEVSAALRF